MVTTETQGKSSISNSRRSDPDFTAGSLQALICDDSSIVPNYKGRPSQDTDRTCNHSDGLVKWAIETEIIFTQIMTSPISNGILAPVRWMQEPSNVGGRN